MMSYCDVLARECYHEGTASGTLVTKFRQIDHIGVLGHQSENGT